MVGQGPRLGASSEYVFLRCVVLSETFFSQLRLVNALKVEPRERMAAVGLCH